MVVAVSAATWPRATAAVHLSVLADGLPDGLVVPVVTSDGFTIKGIAARGDLEGALEVVGRRRARENVYTGVYALEAERCAQLRAVGERGGADDVAALLCLFADIDIAGPNHRADKRYPETLEDAFAVLDVLPAATLVVHTGGGLGAFWTFREALTDIARAGGLLARWADVVDRAAASLGWEVDHLADPCRVMRLAGTLNHKADPPQPVPIWRAPEFHEDPPGYRWEPEELAEWCDYLEAALPALPEPKRPTRPARKSSVSTRVPTGDELNILDSVNAADWADVWPLDWSFAGTATVAGETVERWRRPGATSPHSATCWPDGGCHVFSDAVSGLPAGDYSKAEVLAWKLDLDLSGLARLLIAEGRKEARR